MSKLLNAKHPIFVSALITIFLGIVFAIGWVIKYGISGENLVELLFVIGFAGVLFGMLLVYPIVLTIMELLLFVSVARKETIPTWAKGLDCITVALGIMYSTSYVAIVRSAMFGVD